MDQPQQLAFLQKIAFFYDYDDNELKQFLGVSKWLKVPKSTLVIKQDTTDRAFYILVKGKVGVFKTGDTGERAVPLTTLSNGDCFGEMALVGDVKRTANVKTLQESYILRVEPDIISTSNVFLQLKFYKRFCEIMVSRLDDANRRFAARHEGVQVEGARKTPAKAHQAEDARHGKQAAMKPEDDPIGGSSGDTLPPMPDREKRLTPARLKRRVVFEDILVVNPAVAEHLETVLASREGDENTRRLADLVALDPILTCRVLQTANAPFYRRAMSVTTVAHALIIVGASAIKKILRETLDQVGEVPFKNYASMAPAFWRHGIVVGRVAEMLAEIIGINIQVDLRLAGLVHDLGVLTLDRQASDFYPQLQSRDCPFREDIVAAEREYIGVDHGQAGAWLAESIGLPPLYADVMRFHHFPEKASTNKLTIALINLANIFVIARGVSLRGRAGARAVDPEGSFAWVIIQEEHPPFADVNVSDFVGKINRELDKAWSGLVADIPS